VVQLSSCLADYRAGVPVVHLLYDRVLHTSPLLEKTIDRSKKTMIEQESSAPGSVRRLSIKSDIDKRARILVVDDDPSIRKTISIILAEAGYAVDTAANGEEAIAKSDLNFYNIALIDYRLPDMAGTKLLTLLRDSVPRMMKVMVTGFPMLDNAVDAINRGVDGYLAKPVHTEQLLKTIAQLLWKQRKEQEFTEHKVVNYINSRFKLGRTIRRENETKGTRL
jgi:CheY-like chemotaxis protein